MWLWKPVDLLVNEEKRSKLVAGARSSNVEEWTYNSMFSALDASYGQLSGYAVQA